MTSLDTQQEGSTVTFIDQVGERSVVEGPGAVNISEKVNLSAKQLQDLLSNVVSSLRTEISRVGENIRAENSRLAERITSNLTAKFKEENQKLSDRLTEQFHAETCKFK